MVPTKAVVQTATKIVPRGIVDDDELSDGGLQNLYESEFWLLLGSL